MLAESKLTLKVRLDLEREYVHKLMEAGKMKAPGEIGILGIVESLCTYLSKAQWKGEK